MFTCVIHINTPYQHIQFSHTHDGFINKVKTTGTVCKSNGFSLCVHNILLSYFHILFIFNVFIRHKNCQSNLKSCEKTTRFCIGVLQYWNMGNKCVIYGFLQIQFVGFICLHYYPVSHVLRSFQDTYRFVSLVQY